MTAPTSSHPHFPPFHYIPAHTLPPGLGLIFFGETERSQARARAGLRGKYPVRLCCSHRCRTTTCSSVPRHRTTPLRRRTRPLYRASVVPGPPRLPGNEYADELARPAASCPIQKFTTLIHARRASIARVLRMWIDEWNKGRGKGDFGKVDHIHPAWKPTFNLTISPVCYTDTSSNAASTTSPSASIKNSSVRRRLRARVWRTPPSPRLRSIRLPPLCSTLPPPPAIWLAHYPHARTPRDGQMIKRFVNSLAAIRSYTIMGALATNATPPLLLNLGNEAANDHRETEEPDSDEDLSDTLRL